MSVYQYIHICYTHIYILTGGDEVSYACWEASDEIQQWEDEQGYTGSRSERSEATYEYFVDKAAEITRKLDRTPVQWVEVYEHFGNKLDNNTIGM